MLRRYEEFHQFVTVLEHICDVNGVIKVPLTFCSPFWTEQKLNVQLSTPISTVRTDWRRNLSNKNLLRSCGC